MLELAIIFPHILKTFIISLPKVDPVPEALQATTPLFRQGGQWPFTVAQVQGTVKYLMQSLARDSSLEAAGCLARRGRA